jgi:glutamyl-tRNA synthetase
MAAPRVRFAPSPTGFMHLGNVRAALINYLFARHHGGTFIIRIEDTDAQRNFDPGARHLLSDLAWLGLSYDEGPIVGGPHEPYYQSQRTALYAQYLERLQNKQAVYRCFCTMEDLERQRQRQLAQKRPPRYDRTCLKLTPEQITQRLESQMPFVWRVQLPARTLTVTDLAHGTFTYDLTHFSDCTLTRPDGSFTFLFANFVDDVTMGITHVIRGEDHLTNTGNQAALYTVLDIPVPTFWHLPIMCNHEGKKLSKRDFGFSLKDLQQAGFLPEAILNYLALIGGSFQNTCTPIHELAQRVDAMATTGPISYDTTQLTALNHAWIQRLSLEQLAERVRPWLETLPGYQSALPATQQQIVRYIQPELHTLSQAPTLVQWVFVRPEKATEPIDPLLAQAIDQTLVGKQSCSTDDLSAIYARCKELGVDKKMMYPQLRTLLTGSPQGASLVDVVTLLGGPEAYYRLMAGI